MAFKWTSAQQAAVDAPVANILVTAAAGSGKTQVLTGRIIRRITNGEIDINRLLIMTFTRAAAAQMRERISKALSSELEKSPQNANIRRQLSLLGCAKITTIDAFCMDVVKSNFYAAELEPDFKIADQDELAILKSEAAEEALEELYAEGDPDFLSFSVCYGGKRDDESIISMALSLLNFSESMPYPSRWIDSVCNEYSVSNAKDYGNLAVSKYAYLCALSKIQSARDSLTYAQSFCTDLNGLEKYIAMLTTDLEIISRLQEVSSQDENNSFNKNWDTLFNELGNISFTKRPTVKDADEDAKRTVATLRDIAKSDLADAQNILCGTLSDCAIMHHSAYHYIKALSLISTRISQKYTAMKSERSIQDFSDIAHKCIELLGGAKTPVCPTPIADELMNKYDEIYIDEYQDSNAVQELIFNLISRERIGTPNLFMVGDMKQSIYAFRQTTPELFIKKSISYKEDVNEKHRKITLSKNFRSRSGILDFVNFVFSNILSVDAGGIDYTNSEVLQYGAINYPPVSKQMQATEICVIDMNSVDVPDSDETPQKAELEARLVAEKIHALISNNTLIYDIKKDETRPIRFSDIVILMRSAKTAAPIFEAELIAAGIPVYSDTGTGYYKTPEIATFLSLLSIIDNPLSDIPLIALLRSPIFSFSEDELANIRLNNKDDCFFYAVEKTATLKDILSKKCVEFLKHLSKWRSISKHTPINEFIWFLFEDTGYMNFVSALPSGDVRAANLRLLFEKAGQYENTSFKGLFNFINFVEKMSLSDSNMSAKTIDESHDVVRIMTIHKSKGLEFPVVFLSNTATSFNKKSSQGNLLLHKSLGIGLKYIDEVLRVSYPLPSKLAIAQKICDDDIFEELRVLYVALTRAKEKLIITGIVSDISRASLRWSMLSSSLTPRNILSSKCSLDLICACCLLAGISITENITECDNIDFKIYNKNILPKKATSIQTNISPMVLHFSNETQKRLTYEYPYRDISKIPTKISVTELKRLINDELDCVNLYKPQTIHKPRFISADNPVTAAERGSLIHFVMQTIDIKNTNTLEDVIAFLDDLTKRKMLSPQQRAIIPPEKIFVLLTSTLGKRLKNADKIMREVPFTMPIPASLLTGKSSHFKETVIAQGIIDCFFFENEQIVLIDYKSDHVNNIATIQTRYKLQMDFYALALEKKFFRKISEKFIYLFDNNGIITM